MTKDMSKCPACQGTGIYPPDKKLRIVKKEEVPPPKCQACDGSGTIAGVLLKYKPPQK